MRIQLARRTLRLALLPLSLLGVACGGASPETTDPAPAARPRAEEPAEGVPGLRKGGAQREALIPDTSPVQLYAGAKGEHPGPIAVDAVNVYWGEVGEKPFGPGRVMQAPIAGGAAIELFSGDRVAGVAVDAVNVYVSASYKTRRPYYGPYTYTGVVVQVPIGGGTATTLTSCGECTPEGVAVVGSNVYWLDQYERSLYSAPVGGGTITKVSSTGLRATSLTADGSHAFWTSIKGDVESSALVGGDGTPTVLAFGPKHPTSITLAGDSLYWMGGYGTILLSAPRHGGAATTLVPGGSGPAPGVTAHDGTSVYFTFDSTIEAIPLGGGTVTTVYSGGDPAGLAVSAGYIFWTDKSSGDVWKLALE